MFQTANQLLIKQLLSRLICQNQFKTYLTIFFGDKHPFASSVGYHQSTQVLTRKAISVFLKIGVTPNHWEISSKKGQCGMILGYPPLRNPHSEGIKTA